MKTLPKVDRPLLVTLALVIGSLFLTLILIPDYCGMPSPDWLFVSALFGFSFGLCAFLWRLAERMFGSVEGALVLALGLYLSVGFVGWEVARLTSDDEFLRSGLIWVPFWIVGLLVSVGLLEQCT